MIDNLITLIKSEIGASIGNRVYSSVVPVLSDFPCVLIERPETLPYHTKDGTTRKETRLDVTVLAVESSGSDSAFAVSFDLAINLVNALNALQVSDVEYRVMDLATDYEDEVGAYKARIELVVQSNFTE